MKDQDNIQNNNSICLSRKLSINRNDIFQDETNIIESNRKSYRDKE